jgi:hypothetical protein
MRPDTRYEIETRVLFHSNCFEVLQRIYKYGGQPFVRDYLALHYGDNFDKAFGKGTGKAIMHATAGRCVLVILEHEGNG